MAEPPEFEDLARRYLDLWQEQWSAMAADPEAAQAMARLYGMMGQQMAAAAPMAEAFLSALPALLGPFATVGQHAHDAAKPAAAANPESSVGTAPAGTAPGGGAGDVAELAERVAALEKRLAKLEAKRPARRPAAKSRPGKGG